MICGLLCSVIAEIVPFSSAKSPMAGDARTIGVHRAQEFFGVDRGP
jgi:hypothetical protein